LREQQSAAVPHVAPSAPQVLPVVMHSRAPLTSPHAPVQHSAPVTHAAPVALHVVVEHVPNALQVPPQQSALVAQSPPSLWQTRQRPPSHSDEQQSASSSHTPAFVVHTAHALSVGWQKPLQHVSLAAHVTPSASHTSAPQRPALLQAPPQHAALSVQAAPLWVHASAPQTPAVLQAPSQQSLPTAQP
jgi:hypothetical protein